jgi:hypothetical protein
VAEVNIVEVCPLKVMDGREEALRLLAEDFFPKDAVAVPTLPMLGPYQLSPCSGDLLPDPETLSVIERGLDPSL